MAHDTDERCPACDAPCVRYRPLCVEHDRAAESALRAAYPTLRLRLEQRHGAALDAWLALGRLGNMVWRWHTPERVVAKVVDAVWEALMEQDYDHGAVLRLTPAHLSPTAWYRPYWCFWDDPDLEATFKAAARPHFAEAIDHLLGVLSTAPIERDVIETLTHPDENPDSLHAARDLLDLSGLDEPLRDLLDMRYWPRNENACCEVDDPLTLSYWKDDTDLVPDWLRPIAAQWLADGKA